MKGFYNNRKTLTYLYPNNIEESKLVLERMKKMTKREMEIFLNSDYNLEELFTEIIPVSKLEIKNELIKIEDQILSLKNEINRARPWQVNNEIKDKVLYTKTANTPSFPSGHSLQSYYLALLYSKKYPSKRQELLNLTEKIGQSRISAGLHYPSDHLYSKWLIDNNYIG
tara:strand:- start:3785 stop:4291 length:507 start_codon:yes stop_codon:yes gene_type:complete